MELLCACLQVELLCADFFAFDAEGGFDFIFDYTFFCALPPSMRGAWGKRTAELLKPGGLPSTCPSHVVI